MLGNLCLGGLESNSREVGESVLEGRFGEPHVAVSLAEAVSVRGIRSNEVYDVSS